MEFASNGGEGGGTSRKNSQRAMYRRTATSIDVDGVEQSKMQYDSTGMYHWCPSRDITDCLMDRQEAAMTVLQVSSKDIYSILWWMVRILFNIMV